MSRFHYFITISLLLVSIPTLSYSDFYPFSSPAIAYQPRKFKPQNIPELTLSDLREDLRLLHAIGFRSLVTYGSYGVLGNIPKIAREENFDGMIIMGIWDPLSAEEWQNSIDQVNYVDGYCIGNEGLGVRYNPEEMTIKMNELRKLTNRPVTTSEPIDSYLAGLYQNWLINNSDWLFPIAHPFWAEQVNPRQAAGWIQARYDYLIAATGKQIILKEVGYPSDGALNTSETAQLEFFKLIDGIGLAYYYFEAFDQPWKKNAHKHHEVEAHWGIHLTNGKEKKVIQWLKNKWQK